MRGVELIEVDPSQLTDHETDRLGFEWRRQGRKMPGTHRHRGSAFGYMSVIWCEGDNQKGIAFRMAKRHRIGQLYGKRYCYDPLHIRKNGLDSTDRR